MDTVTLKRGHVRPVWAGHPWVYAQAIASVTGNPSPGAEVLVCDSENHLLGRGLYSPRSAIRVRIYTRNPDEPIDEHLFEKRARAAISRRIALDLPSAETNAYRLIHGEGDNLPGLIVDRYRDVLVVQFGTVGLQQRRHSIAQILIRLTGAEHVLDRTPAYLAKLEGFEVDTDLGIGTPPAVLSFDELGFHYEIPQELKQKTGFYLDQRELRRRVERLASGRRVLDLYCYVGSFSLAAARGQATSIRAVDSNERAIETARALARLNRAGVEIEFETADALSVLQAPGQSYDLVLVDPPKLAPKRSDLEKAVKQMRRIAAASARVTAPGGFLLLCSCSSLLGADELQRAVALGGRDADTEPIVLERLFQGPDHPTLAAFPDGLYLSALLLQINKL